MPIPPVLLSIGAPIVARGVGGLINKVFGNDQREELDLVTPAVNVGQQQLSDVESATERQQLLLEQELARSGSAGVTGSAARERLLRIAGGQSAAARGQVLDRIALARQEQEVANVQARNEARAGRANAINQAFGLVGSSLSETSLVPGTDAITSQVAEFVPGDIILPEGELDLGDPLDISSSIQPGQIAPVPVLPAAQFTSDRLRQRMFNTLQQ